jgi:hypothetical protein
LAQRNNRQTTELVGWTDRGRSGQTTKIPFLGSSSMREVHRPQWGSVANADFAFAVSDGIARWPGIANKVPWKNRDAPAASFCHARDGAGFADVLTDFSLITGRSISGVATRVRDGGHVKLVLVRARLDVFRPYR